MNTFTVTQDHLKLLRRAFIAWCDDETGAPQIDPKRPYGNSDVGLDVAFILGWGVHDEELTEKQRYQARLRHEETEQALQIALSNLPDLSGTYAQTRPYDDTSWRPVG